MAENVTITADQVREKHKAGNATEKKLLEALYPQLFKYEGYKKIDSLEAALKFLGLTKADAKITLSKKLQKHFTRKQASLHLDLIADAIRDGREVDYRNGDQKKWYPWFTYKVPSGFGFSGTDYADSYSLTYVGSRRQFLTHEEAEWFGKQFIELHRIELEGTPSKK
jgi:hypothetical protein